MDIFNERYDWFETQRKRLFSNGYRLIFNLDDEYNDNEEIGGYLAGDRGLFLQRELSTDKESL